MLEPRSRRLLVDALRPPSGFALDCALGTTFSLDLLAALTVPLALSQWHLADASGVAQTDPVLLLDAVRNYLDRIHIFCQAGQISVPRRYRPLFTYMEDAVIQVVAPHAEGVFHPKVWVMRFTAGGEPVHYRLLVLTRNLTFDRSWDTMLALEGC